MPLLVKLLQSTILLTTHKREIMKINVLDAIMGSGKTTQLMNMIAEMPMDTKVIYITPLLSECHRIAGTIPNPEDNKAPMSIDDYEHYYEYDHPLAKRHFKHPQTKRSEIGTKLNSFEELVFNNSNIVSTHALFNNLTPEINKLISNKNYVLVLDEVLTMYEHYDELPPKMLKTLLQNEWLYLEDDGITLKWNHNKGEYEDVIVLDEIGRLCDTNRLLLIDGKAVMIEFPFDSLKCFKEVYIATYLFEGSQMYPYLKMFDTTIAINKFGKKPSEYKDLIEICEDTKMNDVGSKRTSLSVSCYKRRDKLEKVSANLTNFMVNKCQASVNDRIWTVYKPYKNIIGGSRYSKQWLACNTKATNEYQNTWAIAYLINLFATPPTIKLLAYKGLEMDQDKYALSEMVQFIWRSRIRNNQPVKIYVPSFRMRTLLRQWLNNEIL